MAALATGLGSEPKLFPAADDIDYSALSTEDLEKLLNEITTRNGTMAEETVLLEQFNNRVHSSTSATGATGNNTNGNGQGSETRAKGGDEAKKKQKDKQKEPEKMLTLTAEQKAEVAARELEELKDKIEREKQDWEHQADAIRAEMEELDIRVSEIKKTLYELKRDVVQQAINPRTGKIAAERVMRYFEERLRAKDALIEKMRLKNTSLKVQKNKVMTQLKQKEEMGEVLHAIDFDQLTIENAQYQAKIEERNAELLKLKTTAGNTVQTLNSFKRKLNAFVQESEHLRAEISQREELLKKLNNEAYNVEHEKTQAEKVNTHIKKQMEDFVVPDVLEYVRQTAQQQQLDRDVKNWERKVEIQEMALKRLRTVWSKMVAQNKKDEQHQLERPIDNIPPEAIRF